MATFLGYSNFNGKNGDKFSADLLYDILEKNIEGNYYKIRLYGYIRSWGYGGSGNYAIFYINGQNAGGFSSISANQYSEVAKLDVTVPGDNLGDCALNWSLSVSTNWSLGSANAEGVLTLDQIPRASVPTAGTQTIGQALTINTNRKSASFTHNLYYSFGAIGQTLIATGVGDSYPWTLPDNLYTQIPNAKSGTGTIYCETYNGSQKIGDTQTCTFTALVDENAAKPTVTLTVIDTNTKTVALTGNASKLVKYYSTAKMTVSAVLKKYASLKNISIRANDIIKSSTANPYEVSFEKITGNDFQAYAIDSRNLSSTIQTKNPDIVDYVVLTCNDAVSRPEQTGSELKLKVSGNFFNGSFGAKTNTLSLKYRYREKGASSYGAYTSITPTISNNTYSADISMGTNFDYQKAYEVEVLATDLLDSKTATSSISQGIPIMWMGEDSIEAFGKQIIKDKKFNIDLIYPVGSIYMNVSSTDPSTIFGGTWERIRDTFLLACGNTYSNGTTGGKASYKLTAAIGAYNNDGGTIGYCADSASYYQNTHKPAYILNPATQATFSNTNHGTVVTEHSSGSRETTILPPYLAVYVWERTA